MPIHEPFALNINPPPFTTFRFAGRNSARLRCRSDKARRVKRCRRPRRTKLEVDVLTMGGTHRAALASITLFGASLDGGRRLRRREMSTVRAYHPGLLVPRPSFPAAGAVRSSVSRAH